MLVAEHGRVAQGPAGCQIAVLVLRYFVAVLMVGKSSACRRHSDPGGRYC